MDIFTSCLYHIGEYKEKGTQHSYTHIVHNSVKIESDRNGAANFIPSNSHIEKKIVVEHIEEEEKKNIIMCVSVFL